MEVKDLHTFPSGHPPSPWPLPVASGNQHAVLAPTLSLRAVGWLGADVPTRGVTPPECIDRLVKALDSAEVIREGMRGFHSCEVCEALGTFFPGSDEFSRQHFQGFRGEPLAPEHARQAARWRPVIVWREREYIVEAMGHHLIQLDQVVYMCPQLTLHYILHHEYRPPDEFISAITHGRFLKFRDLVVLPDGEFRKWIERLREKRPE